MSTKTDQWQAVLIEGGYVMTLDDFDGNGLPADVVRIAIVRGTAGPDEAGLMPTMYRPDDLVVEFEHFETPEEVRSRFEQAQAMAAGLNGAAK